MACSITITGVIGIPGPSGTTTLTVRVTGTLTGECRPVVFGATSFDVFVEVDCGSGPVSGTVQSDAGGNWTVDIPIECRCGTGIFVRAACATNPDCQTQFEGELPCETGLCPAGTVTATVGDCQPNGKRAVTLTANLTSVPTGGVFAQWQFGDGTNSPLFQITAPGSVSSGPHGYTPPGPYTAQLTFAAACRSLSTTVPPFDPCPPADCPTIVAVTASPSGVCNLDDTRTVSFQANVSGTAQTYHWNFGHGAPLTIDATALGATPNATHDYPAPGTGPSSYTATFTVTGLNPLCVATQTVAVTVPGCGAACPTLEQPTAVVGACAPGNLRNVALDANVIGGGALTYVWQFGDSNSQTIDATITPDPGTTHAYPTPGNFTATLTLNGPPGCRPESRSVSFAVPACPDEPRPPNGNGNGNGGGNGGGGGGLCGALQYIVGGLLALAVATTVLTLVLQLCLGLPVPTWVWGILAGLGIAVAAAIAIWAILCGLGICECSNCDFLALAWMAALAAAVVMLVFHACCGVAGLVFAALLGAAFVGALVYWLTTCKPDLCQVADLVAITLASASAPIVAYLLLIPPLAACADTVVQVALASTVAAAVAAAAACHASK